MLKLIRTNSGNEDFRTLVSFLDSDLRKRDGDEHSFYARFNKIDKINEVVVAYFDSEAVGCGAFKMYANNIAEVKRMYVAPGYRGKGIAGEILKQLEGWAAELAYTRLILETGIKQPEAIGLYIKHGYKKIENYGQYAGVENSVCMEKTIGTAQTV